MEKKVNKINSSNLKNNAKKINVNMDSNSLLSEISKLYNDKIKRKHIISFIVLVIIFSILFFHNFSVIKSSEFSLAEGVSANSFMGTLKQYLLLDAVVILAGITPFFYLSFLGVLQVIMLINEFTVRYSLGISTEPTLFIGGIIQLIGGALCIAVGLYYCSLSTKKNKYYTQSTFGLDDFKMQLYEMRKDTKKIEELKRKKQEKAKKIEECNVKIPYLKFILLGLVAFVIQVIGVLIAKI